MSYIENSKRVMSERWERSEVVKSQIKASKKSSIQATGSWEFWVGFRAVGSIRRWQKQRAGQWVNRVITVHQAVSHFLGQQVHFLTEL